MKIVKFVKEHKKEIAWFAIGATVAIVVPKMRSARNVRRNFRDITEIPKLDSGEFWSLSKVVNGKLAGSVTAAARNVRLADLGKIGDALATVPDVNSDNPVFVCLISGDN